MCIRDSGYTIEWVQHKGRKNKAPMPVRSECVAAIEKLIEITKELRDEADEKDKDTLMIWSCLLYTSRSFLQSTGRCWSETSIRRNGTDFCKSQG